MYCDPGAHRSRSAHRGWQAGLVAQMVKNLPAIRRPGFDPWARKIPRRRAWQPIPVFLPGESRGQRSLAGYSPKWGELEMHKTHLHLHLLIQTTTIPCLDGDWTVFTCFYVPPWCVERPDKRTQIPFSCLTVSPEVLPASWCYTKCLPWWQGFVWFGGNLHQGRATWPSSSSLNARALEPPGAFTHAALCVWNAVPAPPYP